MIIGAAAVIARAAATYVVKKAEDGTFEPMDRVEGFGKVLAWLAKNWPKS